jgi:ribosomal protein L32
MPPLRAPLDSGTMTNPPAVLVCPTCGAARHRRRRQCDSCGTDTPPTVANPTPAEPVNPEAVEPATAAAPTTCPSCGALPRPGAVVPCPYRPRWHGPSGPCPWRDRWQGAGG